MGEFGCREWLSFLPLFSAYVILGSYFLFIFNSLSGYIYLAYFIFIYTGATMWIFCTKCPHYGQCCSYIFAGLLAQKLFSRKEGEFKFLEKAFPVVAFIVLLAFPLLFALDRPAYLLSFLGIIISIAVVKPFIICATCRNTDCLGKKISLRIKKRD